MTTRGRVLRSHTRTNRSARFNQLLELTTALSEADRETKEKVETAEILSLLGLSRKIEPARAPQQQGQLPLPTIQHIAPQPQAQQQPQQPLHQQQAIRPAAAKPVPVLPAPGSNASATTAVKAITKPVEGEKKRKRSKTTPDQLRILMEEFQREPMPNANTRQTLASHLSMTPRSVQIWFQNMRAKVKKANAMSGSAPGEGNKSNSPSLTDPAHESDGPARKRQRTVTGEEDSNNSSSNNNNSKKMDVEQKQPQPQARRSSVAGSSSVAIPSATKLPAHVPLAPAKSAQQQQQQPIKIAVNPQSAFAPTNASAAANGPKARTTEQATPAVAGKLPLPPIQHAAGQPPIFGVPLQYIPQSYHCDQLKRAMPSIAALTNSVQQMTA